MGQEKSENDLTYVGENGLDKEVCPVVFTTERASPTSFELFGESAFPKDYGAYVTDHFVFQPTILQKGCFPWKSFSREA